MDSTTYREIGSPLSKVVLHTMPDNSLVVSVVRYPSGATLAPVTEKAKQEAMASSSKASFRRRVRIIGMGNDFDYFATFTLPSSVLQEKNWPQKTTKALRNHAKYTNYPLRYLMVVAPGKTEDDWHIHALIKGIPDTELYRLLPTTQGITEDQRKRVSLGATLYKWTFFEKKYHTHHELVRIGDIDQYGNPIEKLGKVSYMAKQYDKIEPERYLKLRRRKILCSRGLYRPAPASSYLLDDEMLSIAEEFAIPISKFGGSQVLSEEAAQRFQNLLPLMPSYMEDN